MAKTLTVLNEKIRVTKEDYISNFNYGEFAIIKNQAGLNSYKISVKEWVAKTNAIILQTGFLLLLCGQE